VFLSVVGIYGRDEGMLEVVSQGVFFLGMLKVVQARKFCEQKLPGLHYC
jgi:hypothetical protein